MAWPWKTAKPKPRPRTIRRPSGPWRDYDAASNSYRTDGWLTHGSGANSEVQQGLSATRGRSRDLCRNSPHGKKAISVRVTGLVGTGLTPTLPNVEESVAKKALGYWRRWSKKCYAHSRLGMGGVQTLMAGAWDESGEVLARKIPTRADAMRGLPPFKIQVLEADHLDHLYDAPADPKSGRGRIVQGVEYDADGEPAAYHLFTEHPGESGQFFSGTSFANRVRVPASEIVHLYTETRPGQVRGMPALHAVVIPVWDLDGYNDSNRVRMKGSACHMLTVEGGTEDEDEANPDGVAPSSATDDNDNPVPPTPILGPDGSVVQRMRPGGILFAPNGKTIRHHSPENSSDHKGFNSVSLHEIAAGADITYESLTGDLSGVNFSSIKFGLAGQHMTTQARRELFFIPLALDPIWEWFVDDCIAIGLLPNDPSLYDNGWSRPQIISSDRLVEAKADAIEIRNGLNSREGILAGRGRNIDEIDAQNRADKKRRGDDIILDCDPSQTSGAGMYQGDKVEGED